MLPPTGETVQYTGQSMYRVEGDRIAEIWQTRNTLGIMRQLNPSGVVIAIDVVLPSSFMVKDDYGLNVSGWRKLMSKFIPGFKHPETPGVASIIMQSMMVGSSRSRERLLEQGHADFYINIHVHGVGMLQFEALEEAQKTGYSDSFEPLRKWAGEAGLLAEGAEGDSPALGG